MTSLSNSHKVPKQVGKALPPCIQPYPGRGAGGPDQSTAARRHEPMRSPQRRIHGDQELVHSAHEGDFLSLPSVGLSVLKYLYGTKSKRLLEKKSQRYEFHLYGTKYATGPL